MMHGKIVKKIYILQVISNRNTGSEYFSKRHYVPQDTVSQTRPHHNFSPR
jgi:hypothetical protein